MALTPQEVKLKALAELALATREKVDRATYVLYLEDTAPYSTEVFCEACRRLRHTSAWFPKVSELLDECRIVHRRKEEERQSKRRQLEEFTPITDAQWAEIRRQFSAVLGRKGMR